MNPTRRIAGLGALLLAAPLLAALPATSGFAQVGRNPALQMPAPDDERPVPKLPPDDEDLSRRLDRNDGVIAPPGGVDPDMHVTPDDPDAGRSMPVIPPPDDETAPPGNGKTAPE